MRILTYLCFLLLATSQCSKQNTVRHRETSISPSPSVYTPSDQQKDEVQTMDINGDGVADTIVAGYAGGSGFGGNYGTITNGKTGEKYAIESESCFCEFRNRVDIPPTLLRPENSAFKAKLESEMFPQKATAPDPSLQWILHGLEQKHPLTGTRYFDSYITTGINWQPLPILIPDDYYLEYHNKKKRPSEHYYLTYSGSNHYLNIKGDTLHERFRNDSIVLLTTMHGIILQKKDQYAWVFATDIELTGAPSKLRWASVGYLKILNNMMILNHLRPTFGDDAYFWIDLKTGKCAEIKIDLAPQMNELLKLPETRIETDPLFREIQEEFNML